MTLQEFITQNTGKTGVGDTPQNIGQCVGLVEVWTDNLGLPHTWGNAIDLLSNADPNSFEVVYNDPNDTNQFPPDGAIVTFGKPYGAYVENGETKYAGHTGLSIKSDGTTLRLFEQNDPTGSTPQIKEYSYDGCIGWVIPKIQIPNTQTVSVDSAKFQELVTKSTAYDVFVAGGYKSIDDVNSKIKSLNDTSDSLNQIIKDKQSKIDTLTTQNTDLTTSLTTKDSTITTLQEQANKVPDLQAQLAQAINDRQICNNGMSERNIKIANLEAQLKANKPTTTWGRIKYIFNL